MADGRGALPLGMMLQEGSFDEPPATSTDSSTRESRRLRVRAILDARSELGRAPQNTHYSMPMPPAEQRRRIVSPISLRRRRRSDSPHEEASSHTPVTSAAEERSQRRKRRRLDGPAHLPSLAGIKYGHYGQVEAGRLKLELISCDGGEHRDEKHPTHSLGPANILRHDRSVYCSENPHSNIVLKHADNTPFSLEKLHIIGPENGFTAPVREGLVYVAMDLADLRKYLDPPAHARRRGINTPPYRRRRLMSRESSPEQLTFTEALHDERVNRALRERESDIDSAISELINESDTRYRPHLDPTWTEPQTGCDPPTSSDSLEAVMVGYDQQAGHPVTVLSDEEPGPEDASSQEVLNYRIQRERLARRAEMERWNRSERWGGLNHLPIDHDRDRDTTHSSITSLMARSSMHDSAARTIRTEYRWGSTPAQPEASSGLMEEGRQNPNVLCARFKISKGQHRIAIKFNPPVSGRFILLKVWSNADAGNVDMQSVIAKGYGGCRFFPAVSMR